jgi:D-serine dehydratase
VSRPTGEQVSEGQDASVGIALAGRALGAGHAPAVGTRLTEIALPEMVLKESALSNNIAVMARYALEHGFVLAPHGKTTMAPKIFRRQLDAGAWAITVANTAQAAVAFEAGATRVLVANEVVGRADSRTIVQLLQVPGRSLLCLVDSPAATRALDGNLALADMQGRLDVLLELGAPGCRAGVRGQEEALEVAAAVRASGHLQLAGVEGFEGALAADRSPSSLAVVDQYLTHLRDLAVCLADRGYWSGTAPLIVSAGGSKYFDRVALVLGPGAGYGGHQPLLVVRPGCYALHDHGTYAQTSPLAGGGESGPGLTAALEVWAEVLSVPETGLAIVGMGKRDVSYDLGLPLPVWALPAGHDRPQPFSGGTIKRLDDQHGYLALDDASPVGPSRLSLSVGDLVGFGLSHPCTAFDRWRTVPMVDDQYRVAELIETCFH